SIRATPSTTRPSRGVLVTGNAPDRPVRVGRGGGGQHPGRPDVCRARPAGPPALRGHPPSAGRPAGRLVAALSPRRPTCCRLVTTDGQTRARVATLRQQVALGRHRAAADGTRPGPRQG